ncbi:MAG TPA: hypothetical protein VGV92_06025 [Gammaproteobacteria bacterium]|nr:hypothetical protein [Gammaproteobacteria bacterium]
MQQEFLEDRNKRWETSTASDKMVWEYYEKVIVPRIVHEALQSPTITLKELCYALIAARTKCEWIKQLNPTTPEEVEYYFYTEIKCNLNSNDWRDFALFPRVSAEVDIYNSETWGNTVVNFIQQRLGQSKTETKLIALSQYLERAEKASGVVDGTHVLTHPVGFVLDSTEPDFQALLKSDDLFDYFKHASRIVYRLSNFPTTRRGTASRSKGIIQNIFNEKFKLKTSVLPQLYDWAAFVETPEQYECFYIISTTVNFLRSIPALYEKNKAFYETIPEGLTPAPNDSKTINSRMFLWGKIESFILDALNDGDITLTKDQTKHLNSLYEGYKNTTSLRKPSPATQDYVKNRNVTEKNKAYLSRLFKLHMSLTQQYIESYGNPASEKELYDAWVDLEHLRKLSFNEIRTLAIDLIRANALDVSFFHTLEGKNTQEDESFCVNPGSQLQDILSTGVVQKSDLATHSPEQIELLISPAAVLLYNAHKFIRPKDVIGSNSLETKRIILTLIAKHFCGEHDEKSAETIHTLDETTIDVLLSRPEVYYQSQKVKISELLGENCGETQQNITSALSCRTLILTASTTLPNKI